MLRRGGQRRDSLNDERGDTGLVCPSLSLYLSETPTLPDMDNPCSPPAYNIVV